MWSFFVLFLLFVQSVFSAPTISPVECVGNQGVARLSDINTCKSLARRLANPAYTRGADRRVRWEFLGPRGRDDGLGMLPYSWQLGNCAIGLRSGRGQRPDVFALKEILAPALDLIQNCFEDRSHGKLSATGRVGDHKSITLEVDIFRPGLLGTSNYTIAASEMEIEDDFPSNETAVAPLTGVGTATE